MRALAEAATRAIPERRPAASGRLTGMAYTLNHEEMRVRVREFTARSYEAGAAWLRTVADEHTLSMPPESFVRVVHALTEGLLVQRFLTPELISDDVFYDAFAALAMERRKVT